MNIANDDKQNSPSVDWLKRNDQTNQISINNCNLQKG